MLRNIPNRYSQRFLMDHLRGRGLADRFDFVYLPIDFRSRCNLGYAFVNLMTPADVAQLHAAYQNHLWEVGCSKVCCASYARIQGREALICHFLDARFALDDPEVMPVVFARTEGSKAFDPVSVQNYIARRQLAVGEAEGEDAPAAGRSEEGAEGDTPGGAEDPAGPKAPAAEAAEQLSALPRSDLDSASGRAAEDEPREDCAPHSPSPFATDAPFRGTEATSNSDSLADTFALPTSLSDALVLEDVSDDADDPPRSCATRDSESKPRHDSASSVHGEALDSHSLPKLSSATPA
ncbi:hypothetical protein H632_c2824p0 [Helicosporidium sp. ATCC 50920]|nr:hypothetical protein H632_c2824p0 [Helicosporidium sp. ATCC 50920]|eukprot:KDD72842.1 hypothetical protein H632_c2824p0 [Helicosporidium sp. ATCC 50920]